MPARPSVAVIGGGLAGLVAARAAAHAGARVRVFEASGNLGGCVQRVTLDGIPVEVGAESVAARGTAVPQLLEELGLAVAVTTPEPLGSWLFGSNGSAAPAPKTGPLGLPVSPWAADVRRVIGLRGACRASWDLLGPRIRLRTPQEHPESAQATLGQLVRARLGDTVVTELVGPVTRGVYSMDPEQVPLSMVPGLSAALTRSRRLGKAAATLRAQAPPGARVYGLRGGMSTLIDALITDLQHLGVELRTNAPVSAVTPHPDGGWIVRVPTGVSRAAGVILAATDTVASGLLNAMTEQRLNGEARAAEPELCTQRTRQTLPRAAAGPTVSVVSLLVRAPELDQAPRGTGVLVAQPGAQVEAKALTHASAKWGWVREALHDHPGAHLLRLSYGETNGAHALSDELLVTRALQDASTLTGVSLTPERLLASHRTDWTGTLPAGSSQAQEQRAQHRAHLAALPGIAAAGAWIAGTGIAAVVPDAQTAAAQLVAALHGPCPTVSSASANTTHNAAARSAAPEHSTVSPKSQEGAAMPHRHEDNAPGGQA